MSSGGLKGMKQVVETKNDSGMSLRETASNADFKAKLAGLLA